VPQRLGRFRLPRRRPRDDGVPRQEVGGERARPAAGAAEEARPTAGEAGATAEGAPENRGEGAAGLRREGRRPTAGPRGPQPRRPGAGDEAPRA
jgi:hypothetical protein